MPSTGLRSECTQHSVFVDGAPRVCNQVAVSACNAILQNSGAVNICLLCA
jgi:hypothetical protein